MDKGQNKEAESISDILLAASARQQSGLLNIECIHEGRKEKGELYILAGQPIYARAGKRSGQEALEYILTWHTIRFSLIADASRPPANLSSRVRISPPVIPPNLPPTHSPGVPAARENKGQAGSEQFIPRKIGPEPYAFSLSLTRRQRLIYFLIDGQRTITDLARCSGKAVMEVESILYELQQIGLVVFFVPD